MRELYYCDNDRKVFRDAKKISYENNILTLDGIPYTVTYIFHQWITKKIGGTKK